MFEPKDIENYWNSLSSAVKLDCLEEVEFEEWPELDSVLEINEDSWIDYNPEEKISILENAGARNWESFREVMEDAYRTYKTDEHFMAQESIELY